jgi:hypothetical protein
MNKTLTTALLTVGLAAAAIYAYHKYGPKRKKCKCQEGATTPAANPTLPAGAGIPVTNTQTGGAQVVPMPAGETLSFDGWGRKNSKA